MAARIYALKNESEEMLAATSAKTSRSTLRFDEIAKTIDEDKAAGFLDRVFNGYNDASVADIAVPTVALEDVSILASKVLEVQRRGFYQEKSTRYLPFTRDSVYNPGPEFPQAEVGVYRKAVAVCFDAYEALTAPMMAWAETVIPADTKNRAGAVRGKAFDSLRYLLPCGTTTQLAARMPANDWCELLQQLYVGGNPEFIDIAKRLKPVLEETVPTLIKRAEENPWLMALDSKLLKFARQTPIVQDLAHHIAHHMKQQPPWAAGWSVGLVNQPEPENLVLAQLLYRHSGLSLQVCLRWVDTNKEEALRYYRQLFDGRRNRHDKVPKELEGLHYTFDVVMDYGAYRDLQRQRRCTILPQALTPYLGFSIPDGAVDAGLSGAFEKALAAAGELAQQLCREGSDLAPYATPMAFNHRSTHMYDLAQMYYVGELRTPTSCHISYRRVVERMVKLAKGHHPNLLEAIMVVPTTIDGAHS